MQQKTSETQAESVDRAQAPSAVLCHQTVGRFRVRVASRRKDDSYLRLVRETLERHGSVLEVETMSLTASVRVLHRGDLMEVLSYAENAGLFRVTPKEPRAPTIVHWLDMLDRFDTDVLFPRMEKNPQHAATGLFMLAVLQVLRGSVLPSAPSLLAEAMALLRQAKQRNERDDG